jgi:hypothetical protein
MRVLTLRFLFMTGIFTISFLNDLDRNGTLGAILFLDLELQKKSMIKLCICM